MVKTLLLCFIHGYKGDEETFFQFPEDLKKSVLEKTPELDVQTRVYPKYETRGDLAASVQTFREWLQDQVTDLERNAATPSAILNPSVSVILVAHSMGGFVAADTLFSVLDNRPVSADPESKLMFPLIQGVMAFDTPYNGLARAMFAYGAFSQYQNLSSMWNIFSTISTSLTGSAISTSTSQLAASNSPTWKRWQTLAARTGTYGAIVAGGVAAYTHREQILSSLGKINRENLSKINYRESVSQGVSQGMSYVSRDSIAQGLAYVSRDSIGEGFTWMAGHLKFVGALMKQAQLTTRLERLSQLEGVGLVNFYTSLGENGYWSGGYFVPKRTFCAIPTGKGEELAKIFKELPNPKASDEIEAHCSMFRPEKNSGYEEMVERSRELVLDWVQNDPRRVVDEYTPSREQLTRSRSESQLWDDDGKVLNKEVEEEEKKGVSEDDSQLQAILKSQDMPHPEDGGVDEEALKQALEVPLPPDEEVSKDEVPKQALVIPLPADEEALKDEVPKQALEIPLPADEEALKEVKDEI